MNGLAKLALSALMIGSAAVAVTPASAGTAAGMGYAGDGSRAKPCRFYVHRDLPAPHRCYRFFRNVYGPDVYFRGGYVFRDHEAFLHFRERGEFRTHERLAEREDYRDRENRARDGSEMRHDEAHERYADRGGSEMRHDEERERYADRDRDEASGGASRDGSTVHESSAPEGSGGASRGEHVHEGSGGASQGAHVKESSGGASRGGNRVDEGRSGGASSH